MAVAEFRAVSHRFGERLALDDLSLSVNAGEVYGLLGPNGAGKTTAVRILCGLLKPTAGQAWVDGIDVAVDPLGVRRRLAFVPDGAPLYAQISPMQHLALVGRLFGLSEAEISREGSRLLAALDLGERADDPVAEFSRGMRQKVALACAILPRPKLLVLDEPLEGLDATTTAMVKELLRAWAKRGGSVIYTSHMLDVVERVCDRMAIVDRGKLVAEGSMEELRRQVGTGATTLEEVFRRVTAAEDPARMAAAVLGEE